MTLHHGEPDAKVLRKAGIIGLIVISVLVYFAFTKSIPFTHGYRVNAYFNNAANIQPNAQVRIAGVKVGRVEKVERGEGSTTKVVLELDDTARPVRTDATAKIRFRIFLEGNPFVELQPGTPGAPEIESEGSIPVAQTGGPVQLDQLLSAVNSDARKGLELLFTEIGNALNTVGTPEENKTQEPAVRELTGAEALNKAFRYGPDGFRGGARMFDALMGSGDDDQLKILRGIRDFNEAVNHREAQLVPLIADFATTIGAFADDEEALREATKQFSRLAVESYPALVELNRMLPQVRSFADKIGPQLKEIPATTRAARPWISQTNSLLEEMDDGVAKNMQVTTQGFAKAQGGAVKLIPELNYVARCWNNNWFPTMNTVVPDGAHTSGKENYKEFWYSLIGWNSAAQNFTSTGPYLRLGSGSAADVATPSGALYGKAAQPQTGISPKVINSNANPPVQTKVRCYQNARPNLAPTPGSVTP